MVTFEKFNDVQAQIFVDYSALFYNDKNTTDLELIKWKFVNNKSNNSYHLTIKDEQGVIKGRAVLMKDF